MSTSKLVLNEEITLIAQKNEIKSYTLTKPEFMKDLINYLQEELFFVEIVFFIEPNAWYFGGVSDDEHLFGGFKISRSSFSTYTKIIKGEKPLLWGFRVKSEDLVKLFKFVSSNPMSVLIKESHVVFEQKRGKRIVNTTIKRADLEKKDKTEKGIRQQMIKLSKIKGEAVLIHEDYNRTKPQMSAFNEISTALDQLEIYNPSNTEPVVFEKIERSLMISSNNQSQIFSHPSIKGSTKETNYDYANSKKMFKILSKMVKNKDLKFAVAILGEFDDEIDLPLLIKGTAKLSTGNFQMILALASMADEANEDEVIDDSEDETNGASTLEEENGSKKETKTTDDDDLEIEEDFINEIEKEN